MATSQPALFDPLAELYERYAEINDEIYRPYLVRSLPDSGGRGVDLGCGSGRFTGLLAERCTEVLAVDISSREINIAKNKRAHPNVSYQIRSLLDVDPARDGQFDLVLSVNTLFHLFREHGPDKVLGHVRSLVAPGGHLVVVDVVSPGPASTLRHRWLGVQDAYETLRRRRSLRDAWTVLRLRQHPAWMHHVRTNRPLSRSAFHEKYAAWFPGAEFTDDIDPFICAMRWHNAS